MIAQVTSGILWNRTELQLTYTGIIPLEHQDLHREIKKKFV